MSTCQIPLLTLVIFALPSSVFQQLPCSALPAQERVRYMDQAQSPWQFFQKRLLQLLFIQCLGFDKLYREQCQSVGFNPIFIVLIVLLPGRFRHSDRSSTAPA